MAKNPPAPQQVTGAPPDQQPTAEALLREKTENDKIAEANRATSSGLLDPTPSVRKEFEEHAAKNAEAAEEEEPEYRGPFLVAHTFKYTDPKTQQPVTIKHTRPAVGGGNERRVLQPGDIPDAIAQEAWAEGALQVPTPVPPKPKRPRLAQAR